MKKILILFVLFAFVFLTGCFSFFSYIEVNKKTSDVVFKFVISKTLMQMVTSFGGSDNSDTDKMFDNLDTSRFPKELHVKSQKIDSDYEAGMLVRYSLQNGKKYNDDSLFIPYITKNSITLTLANNKQQDNKQNEASDNNVTNSGQNTEQYASAFLSMAKYTILIKLNIDKKVIGASQYMGKQSAKIPIEKLSDDLYLLEVPLMNWYNEAGIMKIKIDFK